MIQIKLGASVLHKIPEFTFTEGDMGDAAVSLSLRLPVEIDPSFSKLMYVEYRGEKFYLTTTEPQAVKDISSIMYSYTLMFDSERSELKRRMIRDLAWNGIDTYISQGLIFGFNANLAEFCQVIQTNLNDCFGARWEININPALIQVNSVRVEISNSYIWDVLLKIYEYYGCRWKIVATTNAMVIEIGYPAEEISHVFEYGATTGLTKITRENANIKIINRLRGTGGTRNIPVNYFGSRYAEFIPDPNPIAGYLNFKSLMPKCFRDSVIAGGTLIDYVQDSALILKNGLTEDGLEPNEEIYPSIEGVEVTGLGRIDEIVYAEKIEFDNIESAPATVDIAGIIGKATVPYTIPSSGARGTVINEKTEVTETAIFAVVENSLSAKLNLTYIDQYENTVMPVAPTNSYSFKTLDHKDVTIIGSPTTLSAQIQLINTDTNAVIATHSMNKSDINTTKELQYDGLVAGNYKFKITTIASGVILNNGNACRWSTVARLTNIGNSSNGNKQTFDVWVKDIQFDLRDTDPTTGLPKYAGLEEAKISFKSGDLAGYEFVILQKGGQFAVELDTTKSLNGVQSKYKITLIKSEEELEASGKLIPNTSVHAYPHLGDLTPSYGDKFVILDIQMPHSYVLSAEQRLQNYLVDQLELIKIDQPSYTIEFLDIFLESNPDIKALIRAGNTITISDPRLINGMAILYINTLTITHKGLLPKYVVTITNKVTVNGGTVQRIQSQIDALYTGQYQNSQSSALAINALDSRYIRKTVEDVAYQPIKFKKGITVKSLETDNFSQGQFNGAGGAMYKDVDGNTVMEIDRLRVRKEAVFNDIVINQIKFQGGIVVYSAANMEVSRFEKIGDDYRLYFDTKGGTVHNGFELNDIIKCQRISSSTLESKYYSTIVTDFGADFIDISDLSKDPTCVLNPEIGDQIVQFGNFNNPNRQSVIEINVLQGGKQTFYQNVSSFDLTGKNAIEIGMVLDGMAWKTMMRVYGDAYVGSRAEDAIQSYVKFNENTKKVEILADVKFVGGDGTFTDIDGGTVLGAKLLVKNETGDVMGGMSGLITDLYRLWLGGTSPENSNFSVDKYGNMKAVNANLSGVIEALGGAKIGDFEISDDGEIIGRDADGVDAIKIHTGDLPTLLELATPVWENATSSLSISNNPHDIEQSASWYIYRTATLYLDDITKSIRFVSGVPTLLHDGAVISSSVFSKYERFTISKSDGFALVSNSYDSNFGQPITLPSTGMYNIHYLVDFSILAHQWPYSDNLAIANSTPKVEINKFLSRTEIGSNGFMSYWSAFKHFYYSENTPFTIKGDTNISGVLATGSVSATAVQTKRWGAKSSAGAITHTVGGVYWIPLSGMTSANYTVSIQVGADNCYAVVTPESKSAGSFAVVLCRISNNTAIDAPFDYTVFGSN